SEGPEWSTNRDDFPVGSVRQSACIASACMAWRWENAIADGVFRPDHCNWAHAGRTYATEPMRPSWMTDIWRWDDRNGRWLIGGEPTKRGYCGAFGKVEP
ncbi:MAG: hypothetical protein ACREXT_05045, partial [Gammaproteobacteria bacterium]